MDYNVAVIRQLIEEALSSEMLDTLCFDHFQPVYKQFTDSQSKSRRARMLVEHAVRTGAVKALLSAVEAENSRVYEDFKDRLFLSPNDTAFRKKVINPRGGYLHTMCDRSLQASQFNLFFKDNLSGRPGLPQIYLLHGEDGQGHNSFVKRLEIDKIRPYASAIKGKAEGAVHPISIDLQPMHSLEDSKSNLIISIFEEISSVYNARKSIQEMCSHTNLKLFPFVMIELDFHVADWGEQLSELVDWFLNTYWKGYVPGTSSPQFLLFLNFIYPHMERPLWTRLWGSRKFGKGAFEDFLRRVSASVNKQHPCLLFEELRHPERREVCRTLGQLGYHDDGECPEGLKALYRKKRGKVRMVEIERLLRAIGPASPFAERPIS